MESLHGKFGKDETALSFVRCFNWDLDSLLGGVDATVVFFVLSLFLEELNMYTLYMWVFRSILLWNVYVFEMTFRFYSLRKSAFAKENTL